MSQMETPPSRKKPIASGQVFGIELVKKEQAQGKKFTIEEIKEIANKGDVQAQLALGICYSLGKDVDKNNKKAFLWLKKAANQGDAQAQILLGTCYYGGKGVTKNENEAFKWYKKATEQGNVFAQYTLGICYDLGKGVVRNPKKAIEFFEKVAKQTKEKHVATLAQYRLATAYKQGDFGSIDLSKAKEYLHEITDDKEISSNFWEEINQENQEKVTRFIRQTAMNELIDIEKQEAKEKADKEMLSFLTHTLNNSLGTIDESIHIIISTLGTDYKTDANKFKAVSQLLSLASIFSVTNTLIQTFKQYITEPENFKKQWAQDNKGNETVYTTLTFTLQQTFNRLFFRLPPKHITKFFPQLSTSERDQLKQEFVQDIIFTEDKPQKAIIEWIYNKFNVIELIIENDIFNFEKDGVKFTFLFSVFSEIIYNAIRYATEKPIIIKWFKEGDYFCFSCSNHYSIEKRYKEEKSQQGLVFIRRLLELLKLSELVVSDTNGYYTVIIKIHQDNFI